MAKMFLSFILAVLATSSPVFAKLPADVLRETSVALDETVRNVELKRVVPELARILKMDPAAVDKAMVEKKYKLSGVVLAKFISEKSNQPVEELLKEAMEPDWIPILRKHNLNEIDAEAYIDNLHSEIAFAMLDYRGPATANGGKKKK
jgi:hypothetical protein